jgi:hypothetical protein
MATERSPFAPRLPEDTITPTKQDYQREQLKRDLAGAKSLKDYAWLAIQNGCDPAYVAMRYGFKVEEMERAKKVWEQREAERLARETRGNEP